MASITVYATPARLPAIQRLNSVHSTGRIPPAPPSTLSQTLCLMRHTDSGEYLTPPVLKGRAITTTRSASCRPTSCRPTQRELVDGEDRLTEFLSLARSNDQNLWMTLGLVM